MSVGRRRNEKNRQPKLMDGQDDISFRRSRTLQGSTSSNVKIINQKRAKLQSERLKGQKLSKRRRQAMTVGTFLLVVAVSTWYLTSQYSTEVGSISFEPATSQEPEAMLYKKAIERYLTRQPSERFRFVLNEQQLNNYLAGASLPEVQRIKASGGGDHKADFSIRLRVPIASWKTSGGQSFVDKEGVSFSRNYFSNPTVAIVDNSGVIGTGRAGEAVVSERFLRFLGRLLDLVDSSGLGAVTEASLPQGATREIDIKLKDRPYFIKTHIDRDPAATTEDIKRVVQYLEQRKISPAYIDVRIAGRAFYK